MALDQGAEVHVPRVLPGEEVHDDQAEAAGGGRAVRPGQGPPRIRTLHQADLWVERLLGWCDFWNDFLNERTRTDGRWEYAHERLRKARRWLVRLVNEGTLCTYLDPGLAAEGPLPSTNNVIEGGVNAQLRSVLRNHRGLKADRRVKAVYWWCYMHTEAPKGPSGPGVDADGRRHRRPARALFGEPRPEHGPRRMGQRADVVGIPPQRGVSVLD